MYSLTLEQKVANLREQKKLLEDKVQKLEKQISGIDRKIQKLESVKYKTVTQTTGSNYQYGETNLFG